MKQEDFERLKAVCEKEGFDVDCKYPDSGLVFVKKKDIWDGVEFVEYIGKDIPSLTNGRIYLRDLGQFINLKYSRIGIVKDDQNESNGHLANLFQPSTEQAYIEQLKKEVYERFGEIKEGDRFQMPNDGIDTHSISYNQFKYIRESDSFYLGYVKLYQQGKWATRVKERVKITPLHTTTEKRNNDWKIDFSFSANNRNFSLNGASTFLASQLEKYLNLDGYSVDVSGETLSIHVKIRNGVDLEDLKEKAESLAKIVKKI